MQMKTSEIYTYTSESKKHPEGLSKHLTRCQEDTSTTSTTQYAAGIAQEGWPQISELREWISECVV